MSEVDILTKLVLYALLISLLERIHNHIQFSSSIKSDLVVLLEFMDGKMKR